MVGTCALTSKQGTFVRSHLYPRSFYPGKEKDEHFAIIGGGHDERPGRSWTGIYDEYLVVQEGEDILQKIDQTGYSILKPGETIAGLVSRSVESLRMGGRVQAIRLDSNLIEPLLVFLCSVMWRFHQSSRSEARTVNVGSYGEKLRDITLNQKIGERDQIAAFISRIPRREEHLVLTPARFRDGSTITHELIFGGYRVWFKCGNGSFSGAISDLAVRMKHQLWITFHNYAGTRSYKDIAGLARKKFAKYGDPWKGRFKDRYR